MTKAQKNAGLFIYCGVIAKRIQTIAISLLLFCKNTDFYTKKCFFFLQKCRFLHKKRKGKLWGFSGLPEQNYEVFFVPYGNLDFDLTTFTHQLHSGCWFWPMKLQQTLSVLVDLNLNPLVWSVVLQIKLQPLVWNMN